MDAGFTSNNGPAGDPRHVQEWTSDEFKELCGYFGLVEGTLKHVSSQKTTTDTYTQMWTFKL
jgi:hypothetical protein